MAATPHDALFKAIFGAPEHAASALRPLVPDLLAGAIDWATLAPAAGSFVDGELREQRADLLFTARWIEGAGTAPAFFLFEHQSTPDPRMALRLVRYTLRILERWCAHHPDSAALPMIVPVVLYHAEVPWPAARSLEAHVALPAGARAALARAGVRFAYVVDDLPRVSDAALCERGMTALATLAALCLKHGRTPVDVVALLLGRLELVRASLAGPGGHGALELLLRYILEVNEPATPEAVLMLLDRAGATYTEDIVMTWGQRMMQQGIQEGIEQGIQQGIQQGLQRGREQGKCALLLLQLRHRFGAEVDEAVEERVAAAPVEQIERWSVRLLTAPTLTALLAE